MVSMLFNAQYFELVPTSIFQTHNNHIFETQEQASTLEDDTMMSMR
jgi:hypothetical protein